MGGVKSSASSPSRHLDDPPVLLGTVLGIISSLSYTAANVYLRKLAGHEDVVWISCIKAVPVAVVAWLLVGRLVRQGRPVWPNRRQLLWLMVSGVLVQLGGNVAFQWSLGQIGLAMTVPLMFGSLILSGALMGRFVLHEPITSRSAIAMLILIIAISILSLGTPQANRSVAEELRSAPGSAALLAAAVAVACLAGVSYAMVGIVIRRVLLARLPVASTLMVISTTGIVVLGAVSLGRVGLAGLLATGEPQFRDMLVAGVFNMLAFFALGKSLEVIPVVRVNALNASQAAMAGVAGVLIFGETLSPALIFGAALTVVGLIAVQGGSH